MEELCGKRSFESLSEKKRKKKQRKQANNNWSSLLLLFVTSCYSSILALWAASSLHLPLRSNKRLHLQFPIWQAGREITRIVECLVPADG